MVEGAPLPTFGLFYGEPGHQEPCRRQKSGYRHLLAIMALQSSSLAIGDNDADGRASFSMHAARAEVLEALP